MEAATVFILFKLKETTMIPFSLSLMFLAFYGLIIGIIIFLISAITADVNILGDLPIYTFFLSIIIIIVSIITILIQCEKRDRTKQLESYYYSYIITTYEKRDTCSPLEITRYNTYLAELQTFQAQHPECLFKDCNYNDQPYLPLTEEN